jgi:pyridoxal 5'-phosphate synthase pdxT subunit
MPRIGVLALQGAFREHKNTLEHLGSEVREVRLPRQLEGLDGLVIPGGESTTIGKLMVEYKLQDPLRRLAMDGLPIFGTCAGMIVLAKDIGGLDQPLVGVMDIKVCRNAFGRQLDSFEVDIPVPVLGPERFHAVFIRAPIIEAVGAGVEALARLDDGRIVAAREDKLLVTAFHPELTLDRRLHSYFLAMLDE